MRWPAASTTFSLAAWPPRCVSRLLSHACAGKTVTMRWFALMVLLAGASAQGGNLAVGSKVTTALYPASARVAYGQAREIARSLGLGYQELGDLVVLSLGSKAAQFRIAAAEPSSDQMSLAWKREGQLWIPIKTIAARLDLDYRMVGAVHVVGLKPARLISVQQSRNGSIERLTFVFDRDVQAKFLDQERLALIGVFSFGGVDGVAVSQMGYGLEASLPPSVAGGRLYYLPRQVVIERGTNPRPIRIVIDAGHGGTDTGMVVGGLQEKDLTLSLASRVSESLKRKIAERQVAVPKVDIELTRGGDADVGLSTRALAATFAKVFISLHASPGSTVVLYRQPDGAGLTFFDKGQKLLANTPEPQRSVLELFVAERGFSARLSQQIMTALASKAIVSTAKEGASYKVLSQAGGAAILAEIGFERLRTPELRALLADTVADAILEHLGIKAKEPASRPPGSTP